MRIGRQVLGLGLGLVLPWLASAALAGSPPADLYGAWVFKAGSHNLFVLTLKPGTNVELPITGDFVRPTSLAVTGNTYFNIQLPNVDWPIVESAFFDGRLHFTTTDSAHHGQKDTHTLTLLGDDTASLTHDGGGGRSGPLYFSRAGMNAIAANDWDKDTKYVSADTLAAIPEIRRLYDADQSDRTSPDIDWKTVHPRDVTRREAARKLLADGALKSGDDYEQAAFIFQHSDKTSDYLLAHTLAVIAVNKGHKNATWIAAATLDRYLLKIGQPQIYGTQYGEHGQQKLDRGVIFDDLREEMGVPTLVEQDEQDSKSPN